MGARELEVLAGGICARGGGKGCGGGGGGRRRGGGGVGRTWHFSRAQTDWLRGINVWHGARNQSLVLESRRRGGREETKTRGR